ncbi:MAG: hypothetical protein P8Y60_17020 [Calditrichota bacterium]
MCGIVGAYNLREAEPIARESMYKMLEILQHRGPDESGLYLEDQVSLGSVRLSIIDLEGGSQPIHIETILINKRPPVLYTNRYRSHFAFV